MDTTRLEARRQHTSQKAVWLTDEGKAAIQAWADANGTSFSAAIETLARLNLGESPASAMAPMMVSVVRRAVLSQMERFAKLATVAAIQGGIATNISRAALRMGIQDRAKASPGNFADTIFDVTDDDPVEESYRQICDNARRDAVRSLRGPLEGIAVDVQSLEQSLSALLSDPGEG